MSEPESTISQDEKYYFDTQPWKKKKNGRGSVKVDRQKGWGEDILRAA